MRKLKVSTKSHFLKFPNDLENRHQDVESGEEDRLSELASKPIVKHPNGRCLEASKAVDTHFVPVDTCVINSNGDHPIRIVSQNGNSVAFAVVPKWKEWKNSGQLSWIATDFVAMNGELSCRVTTNDLNLNGVQTYKAQCEDGVTVIDLFIHDKKFGQFDGSSIQVPSACNASGDATKICHSRYMVHCNPSLCIGLGTQSSFIRHGSSDNQNELFY